MAGAFDTVKILDPQIASILNPKFICPTAMQRLGALNLITGAGRILEGSGALRDRFANAAQGLRTRAEHTPHLQLVA